MKKFSCEPIYRLLLACTGNLPRGTLLFGTVKLTAISNQNTATNDGIHVKGLCQ